MINITREIQDNFSYFSPVRLRSTFELPNMYYASSIADFLHHKDQVEATKEKLFGKQIYTGTAAIAVHNCTIEQNSQPKALNWLWYQDLAYLRFRETLGDDDVHDEIEQRLA